MPSLLKGLRVAKVEPGKHAAKIEIARIRFRFRLDGISCAILKYLQCIKVVFAGSISFTRDVPRSVDSQKVVSRHPPVLRNSGDAANPVAETLVRASALTRGESL